MRLSPSFLLLITFICYLDKGEGLENEIPTFAEAIENNPGFLSSKVSLPSVDNDYFPDENEEEEAFDAMEKGEDHSDVRNSVGNQNMIDKASLHDLVKKATGKKHHFGKQKPNHQPILIPALHTSAGSKIVAKKAVPSSQQKRIPHNHQDGSRTRPSKDTKNKLQHNEKQNSKLSVKNKTKHTIRVASEKTGRKPHSRSHYEKVVTSTDGAAKRNKRPVSATELNDLALLKAQPHVRRGRGLKSVEEPELPSAGSTARVVAPTKRYAKRHEITAGAGTSDSEDDRDPEHIYGAEEAETKLKAATKQLVKWLRNRLRKRLEDVAVLEENMETEKILLLNLNESIESISADREHEIQLKLETQKNLSLFRQTSDEPEREMKVVQDETEKLSNELIHLKHTYEMLATGRKELRRQLMSAGVGHWLESRGKEYMPDTAVGVLSKSVEVLSPVSQGLERAIELDRKVSKEVEGVILDPEASIIGKVIGDVAMLTPLVPILVVVCRVAMMLKTVSVVQVVMYTAGAFVLECIIVMLAMTLVGHEGLLEMQMTNEMGFVLGIFINCALFCGLMMMQALISAARPTRSDIAQTGALVLVGHHFLWHVFQPAMVSKAVTLDATGIILYTTCFTMVGLEKKRKVGLKTLVDKHVYSGIEYAWKWGRETAKAMRGVFAEREVTDMISNMSTMGGMFTGGGGGTKKREGVLHGMQGFQMADRTHMGRIGFARMGTGGVRRGWGPKKWQRGVHIGVGASQAMPRNRAMFTTQADAKESALQVRDAKMDGLNRLKVIAPSVVKVQAPSAVKVQVPRAVTVQAPSLEVMEPTAEVSRCVGGRGGGRTEKWNAIAGRSSVSGRRRMSFGPGARVGFRNMVTE